MEPIRNAAEVSVARGCGFGLLAICCVVFGFLSVPAVALKMGGILCLVASFVLMLKARLVHQRSYRKTETWVMLAPEHRPPERMAQQVISRVLAPIYLRFALHFGSAAAVMLAIATVLGLAGFRTVL